ncbi:sensor histidine kinase [Thiohalomonas denitrificans]|uniref:Two-component system, LytT family, sensor histidine kinase AlgZ n=1 Tax=Thiohalomonas denitrificans TaxID=415747 RepID=A0A1G5QYG2_9GAMM|nr:sensor histidine kinase [Thiohalomonas denitrificans]SCZ66757.1 two-component system, LytT family, sensor histidine kinase AlgZ [Thiohalomonas denitrificans]
MPSEATDSHRRGSFLPDFCALPMVFGVVVLSELFAIVLVLASSRPERIWDDLALVSLFMQWAGLSGAALLCVLRKPLSRLGDIGAGTASYLLLVLLVLLLSEGAYHLLLDALPGEPEGHFQFVSRNLAVGAIVAGIILRYFYIRHQWRLQVEAKSEARLQALQARIRPHFLFNSLNTAASLTHEHPELAEQALEDLADLFRASLSDSRTLVPFADELSLSRRYLAIEQLRLGERLRVRWDVEAIPEQWAVPPLVLQPLLENAVCHGIEPLAGGGMIDIAGRRSGRFVDIEVVNPEMQNGAPRTRGSRMAVDNIRQRLAACYGAEGELVVERDGDEYRARLRIPERSKR